MQRETKQLQQWMAIKVDKKHKKHYIMENSGQELTLSASREVAPANRLWRNAPRCTPTNQVHSRKVVRPVVAGVDCCMICRTRKTTTPKHYNTITAVQQQIHAFSEPQNTIPHKHNNNCLVTTTPGKRNTILWTSKVPKHKTSMENSQCCSRKIHALAPSEHKTPQHNSKKTQHQEETHLVIGWETGYGHFWWQSNGCWAGKWSKHSRARKHHIILTLFSLRDGKLRLEMKTSPAVEVGCHVICCCAGWGKSKHNIMANKHQNTITTAANLSEHINTTSVKNTISTKTPYQNTIPHPWPPSHRGPWNTKTSY